ncbi:MAG: winged helix-turn-helix transcriptional regulator [Acidimicrobiales bacterium]
MPDYGLHRLVSIASEVVADRWTPPSILRELVLGNTRFNDIARGLPGISRSLLVQRLKHLEARVQDVRPLANGRGHEYHLTDAGRDLEAVLHALGRWAVQWMYHELDANDIEAEALMWWLHRRVDASALPAGRVVVEFDHTAPVRRRIWLLNRGELSVCLFDPGFGVDAVITCTTPALARCSTSGERTWRDATRAGDILSQRPAAPARCPAGGPG